MIKKFTAISLMFVLLQLVSFWSKGQTNSVSGTVSDSNGEPLIGVSVLEKGTLKGTTTNAKGFFELTLGSSTGELSISYIGYKSQTKAVNANSKVEISLQEDQALLDEVVVVGYGTLKKSDLTGSLASVSAKDFEKQPLTRIDQALQGRAAGVSVTQTSGAPGAGFKIRVRGANSISGSNAPLYVVDGMVVGDINTLNVNDVASMEVLKDASATAIYGSRGANGVVLITTKSGKKGPAKIEFQTFAGQSKIFQRLDVMSPAEFAEGVNYAEGKTLFTAAEIDALRAGGGENWQNRLFQNGTSINSQLSISGASDKVDYFISGNIYNATGTIVDQSYRRYNLRANLNAQVSSKLKMGMNVFLGREIDKGVRANLAEGLTWDLTTPAINPDGTYNYVPLKPGVGNGSANALIAAQNNVRENYQDQIIVSSYLNYQILKNLTFNISGGLEQRDDNNNSYTSLVTGSLGIANVATNTVNRYQNTNRLTYYFDKFVNHRIQIDAVHEQQYVVGGSSLAYASGFFSDNTTYKNLGLGALQRTTNNNYSEGLQSFLGRINYSAFDKYLLTLSVRSDGSSKFREGNRWGVFPSGSLAWRVSEEKFLKNNTTINDLKLRVSYGVTGSQAIGPKATRAIPIAGGTGVNYPFTGGTATIGVAPSDKLANPNLTWETTSQGNAGFDLALLNSKITVSFDAYTKRTTNLLLDRILPAYVGPSVITQNVGEVENKGFDVNLGLVIAEKKDFNLNANVAFSRNRNKVIKLIENNTTLQLGNAYYQNTFPVNPTRVQVGSPISSYVGYIFEGVYQIGEESEAAKFGRKPGDAKYKDVNGDGKISSDDLTIVGDGNPNFTYGINFLGNWNKVDFNFNFIGSQGNEIYNLQYMRMMGLGSQQFHAVHADYVNRWTPTNPSNIPANRNTTQALSSQFIQNGSFLSLNNASIGYNVSGIKSLGIGGIRLFINAENLFILTNYRGFDPVSTASGGSDVDLGIDLNTYPISKSYTAGLKITF